eukprot:7063232-Pyramimonas_sp.AAC.1
MDHDAVDIFSKVTVRPLLAERRMVSKWMVSRGMVSKWLARRHFTTSATSAAGMPEPEPVDPKLEAIDRELPAVDTDVQCCQPTSMFGR